ncbi:putative mitochondrial protein [Cucumis melo var. makuwa]|uniref:Mitochondrial protein n=1 Tax=Cucumis melo var. makuwa TaxID=1194695 RepID=A0A5A7T0D2_CUCMM|nr:putative mitochondrial protein [Cucumis melo var. makuwa]
MVNPTEPCIDNKMSENGRCDVVVLENVEEKNSSDKTENKAETGQFMQAPYEEYMEAVNRILRYLKMALGIRLMFKRIGRKTIEAYTDLNWVGYVVDRKSTSATVPLYGAIL